MVSSNFKNDYNECTKVYIGETGQSFCTSFKEHKVELKYAEHLIDANDNYRLI